jgi:hypothetical protein
VCRHTDTIDAVHTRAARFTDLHDDVIRLMQRRPWHGLRRRCEHEKTNHNPFDHTVSPILQTFSGMRWIDMRWLVCLTSGTAGRLGKYGRKFPVVSFFL